MTAIKMFVIKKISKTKNKTIFQQITVELNANLFLKTNIFTVTASISFQDYASQ